MAAIPAVVGLLKWHVMYGGGGGVVGAGHMCVNTYTHAVACVWRSEDILLESVFTFYHWSPGVKLSQVTLLSGLASPSL